MAWVRHGKALQQARPLIVGLCYALLTTACTADAYWHVFSSEVGFDEGYLLLSLKQFVAGHALFTDVYSQYGPAYYELWGGIFSLFGIPVTHDAGRLATVATWVLASLLMGIVVQRLTRRLLLGLLCMITSFGVQEVDVGAPMHPGATTCLGLIAIIAVAVFVRPSARSLGLVAIGAVAAAIALMKVNVGGLALLAVLLAVCFTERSPAVLRAGAATLYLAAPLVLLSGDLGKGWAATFAATVIAGGVALVLAAAVRAPAASGFGIWRSLRAAGLGAAGVVLLSIVIAVALGTRPSDLVDSVLIAPTRQRDALLMPFGIHGPELLWSAIGLGFAAAVVLARRRAVSLGGPLAAAMARLVAGGLVLVAGAMPSVVMPGSLRMGFALPLAWVAALPPAGNDPLQDRRLVRLLVPAIAVLQPLHAYPIPGSQVPWGWLMFIPVGALCIADGLSQLEAADVRLRVGGRRVALAPLAALVVAIVGVKFTFDDVARPLRNNRDAYLAGTPLPFHGSEMIHVRAAAQKPLTAVVSAIDARCPNFLTLPGMNSFYLWSDTKPPTGMNTTSWMYLLSAQQQQRVVDRVKSERGLCLLTHKPELDFWRQGRPLPDRPLVRFTSTGFKRIQRLPGDYVLSVRVRRGA